MFIFLTLRRPYTDSHWSTSISCSNSCLSWLKVIHLDPYWYAQSIVFYVQSSWYSCGYELTFACSMSNLCWYAQPAVFPVQPSWYSRRYVLNLSTTMAQLYLFYSCWCISLFSILPWYLSVPLSCMTGVCSPLYYPKLMVPVLSWPYLCLCNFVMPIIHIF